MVFTKVYILLITTHFFAFYDGTSLIELVNFSNERRHGQKLSAALKKKKKKNMNV